MRGCHLRITELAEPQNQLRAMLRNQARRVLCVFRVKVLERLHRLRQVLLAKI